jgi:hypothetical protein
MHWHAGSLAHTGQNMTARQGRGRIANEHHQPGA